MPDRPFPTTAPAWTSSRLGRIYFPLCTPPTRPRTPGLGLPWPLLTLLVWLLSSSARMTISLRTRSSQRCSSTLVSTKSPTKERARPTNFCVSSAPALPMRSATSRPTPAQLARATSRVELASSRTTKEPPATTGISAPTTSATTQARAWWTLPTPEIPARTAIPAPRTTLVKTTVSVVPEPGTAPEWPIMTQATAFPPVSAMALRATPVTACRLCGGAAPWALGNPMLPIRLMVAPTAPSGPSTLTNPTTPSRSIRLAETPSPRVRKS
mmetsp:Transcript_12353/g.29156  ORF Transcript_12353/g.29156 Transcript_12353/m.29156 type:complete len:269 (-) Transcript_12353:353-1159(-)